MQGPQLPITSSLKSSRILRRRLSFSRPVNYALAPQEEMVCVPVCLTNTYVQTDVRAGGHLRPDLYSATSTYTERYGIGPAVEVVRFEIAHMKILEELVRKEKIDCDLTFSRSYDIYLDADQLADAKKFYDFLVEQGLDFMEDVKYLSQEEAQGVSRSCAPERNPCIY